MGITITAADAGQMLSSLESVSVPYSEDEKSSAAEFARSQECMKYTSEQLTFYAATLGLVGIALLFAPEEVSAAMSQGEGATHALFVQLLGAALIGFASSNWIVRHSPVGGIYGRAVVLGNQAFSLVGALALIGGLPAKPGPAFWILLIVFAGGAVLHGMLLLRGPQLSGSREEPPEAS